MSVRPDPSAFVKPADVWARAIIAAARVYGEDPVEALTSPSNSVGKRRSLAPACWAIIEGLGLSINKAAVPLGLQPSTVRARKAQANRQFKEAHRAAARAVEYALWRPEAAESVAQAVGELDLTGAPGAEVIGISWEAQLAQAVEALPTPEPAPVPLPPAAPVNRPHTPLAGRVNLANGHAFAPPFRPGPPPPTQSMDGRILAQLAQRGQASARGLASILDIKEAFVAQTLRNLSREGRVTAADLAPGQSDRDQAWSLA
jgi:hypothetical protein